MKKILLLVLLVIGLSPPLAAEEPSYGYATDENGRPYQTHFDLRRRWMWGGGTDFTPDLTGYVETRAEYEDFEEWNQHRDRHEFLAGRVDLGTSDYDATLYLWERSRYSDVPSLWVTTFVGTPTRFDIPIHLGPLFGLGLVRHRAETTVLDAAKFGFHWSWLQSSRLEDFLRLQLALSSGARFSPETEEALGLISPEGALQWRWSPGERGLWEMSGSAGARYDYAPAGESTWLGRAQVEIERVLIAVNDQPITLLLAGTGESDGTSHSWRATAGLRVSLFAPPPPPPDQCPGSWEDFDGFQDQDGCPDPDNDGDGVLDASDYCPLDPGTAQNNGCPEVIPVPLPQSTPVVETVPEAAPDGAPDGAPWPESQPGPEACPEQGCADAP